MAEVRLISIFITKIQILPINLQKIREKSLVEHSFEWNVTMYILPYEIYVSDQIYSRGIKYEKYFFYLWNFEGECNGIMRFDARLLLMIYFQ